MGKHKLMNGIDDDEERKRRRRRQINSKMIQFNPISIRKKERKERKKKEREKIIQYSSNVLIRAPVSYVSNQRSIEKNIHYCILPTSALPEAGDRNPETGSLLSKKKKQNKNQQKQTKKKHLEKCNKKN